MALSTLRRYRRRTEAPPSERENRRDAKIAAGLRVGLDSAAVRGYNGLGHRKPDAVTARVGAARRVDAVEAVKHPRQLRRRQRRLRGIGYGQAQRPSLRGEAERDRPVRGRIFERVVQQQQHQPPD